MVHLYVLRYQNHRKQEKISITINTKTLCTMALRGYIQELIRDRNAYDIKIVHDVSMSSLPFCGDDDHSMDASELDGSMSSLSLHDLKECNHNDSNRSLDFFAEAIDGDFVNRIGERECSSNSGARGDDLGLMLKSFRERHRRLKQTLSPVKVYQLSPTISGSQTTPTKNEMKVDNQRSRLAILAKSSEICGPPSLTDH